MIELTSKDYYRFLADRRLQIPAEAKENWLDLATQLGMLWAGNCGDYIGPCPFAVDFMDVEGVGLLLYVSDPEARSN
jgi:hypothetical protein